MRRVSRLVMAVLLWFVLASVGCGRTGADVDAAKAPEQTAQQESQESSDALGSEDLNADASDGEALDAEAEQDDAQAEASATDDAAGSDADERAALQAQAVDAGLSVFEGTVRVLDGLELCQLEDVDPQVEDTPERVASRRYVVLSLDEPTEVWGQGPEGTTRHELVDHVCLRRFSSDAQDAEQDSAAWEALDGVRVCVAGTPWFQTDVSLPFCPRVYDAQLLYEEA